MEQTTLFPFKLEEKLYFTEYEKEDIAEQNIKLVYFMANKFRSTGINMDDLIGAGMFGYAKAINTYDKNRNVRFSTYASNCIRNEILYYMRKENKHRKENVSLNTILSTDKDGNPFELVDIVMDDTENDASENVIEAERTGLIREAISRLDEKEQFIIYHRFGLLTGVKRTQKNISEEINMSQANVSKLQKNATEKLQRLLRELSGDQELTLEKIIEL